MMDLDLLMCWSGSVFTSRVCVCVGQCWAHQQCALWSEGVCQAEDQSLLYVDRAIHSGSTEVRSDEDTLSLTLTHTHTHGRAGHTVLFYSPIGKNNKL